MIRAAETDDADRLTRLSFASKRHWGYPEHYLEIWRPELTITPRYIGDNIVNLSEEKGRITGYYSLVTLAAEVRVGAVALAKGTWIEHMFVDPVLLGNGIGTRLFNHLCLVCRRMEVPSFQVLADPNARGFYEKMGCRFLAEYPSTIEGRTTPLLRFEF